MGGAGGSGEGGHGLTLVEICDSVYGLWLEQLREQYLADRTAFGVWALTSHAKDAVPPSWDERQAEFDQRLADDGRTPSVLERFGIRLAA